MENEWRFGGNAVGGAVPRIRGSDQPFTPKASTGRSAGGDAHPTLSPGGTRL